MQQNVCNSLSKTNSPFERILFEALLSPAFFWTMQVFFFISCCIILNVVHLFWWPWMTITVSRIPNNYNAKCIACRMENINNFHPHFLWFNCENWQIGPILKYVYLCLCFKALFYLRSIRKPCWPNVRFTRQKSNHQFQPATNISNKKYVYLIKYFQRKYMVMLSFEYK